MAGAIRHGWEAMTMSDAEEAEADEGAEAGQGAAWSSPSAVVKWLIPSFGLLFLLVGYVVHSAHESLLGFPDSDGSHLEKSAYAADAADFLRDLLTSVGELLIDDLPRAEISVGGHVGLVLASLLAAALAVALARIERLRSRAMAVQAGIGVALVVLIAVKFVMMDAPLTHVEHVMVGTADYRGQTVESRHDATPPLRTAWTEDIAPPQPAASAARLAADTVTGPRSIKQGILKRSARLWGLIVCSRLGGLTLPGNPGFSGAHCASPPSVEPGDRPPSAFEAWKKELSGEYLAQVVTAIGIAVVATSLLRAPSALAKTVALLSLFSLLSVPYAYGKLVESVNFVFAKVSLVPGSPHGAPVLGFVVGRDGDHLDLLEAEQNAPCSYGTHSEIRFASLPASQILAIEQIYRRDIITWKVQVETSCPALPPILGDQPAADPTH